MKSKIYFCIAIMVVLAYLGMCIYFITTIPPAPEGWIEPPMPGAHGNVRVVE
jgi:hypothetical protein